MLGRTILYSSTAFDNKENIFKISHPSYMTYDLIVLFLLLSLIFMVTLTTIYTKAADSLKTGLMVALT